MRMMNRGFSMVKICQYCKEEQKYKRLAGKIQICTKCLKPLFEERKLNKSPAVLSNKGGKRVYRI